MALSADKLGAQEIRHPSMRGFSSIAASVAIYAGAMVAIDTSGNVRPARATATDKVLGVAKRRIASQAGAGAPADGGKVDVECNIAVKMKNSLSADLIADADVGAVCYAVDDETVAKTSNSSARPVAGIIYKVDADGGVFVFFPIKFG